MMPFESRAGMLFELSSNELLPSFVGRHLVIERGIAGSQLPPEFVLVSTRDINGGVEERAWIGHLQGQYVALLRARPVTIVDEFEEATLVEFLRCRFHGSLVYRYANV